MEMTIKQGDLFPDVEITVLDENGLVVDVTEHTFTFSMRNARDPGTAVLTDRPAVILNAVQGLIAYAWSSPETDIAEGTYEGEFKATPPAGDPFKVPTVGYVTIYIQRKIA